MSNKKKQIEELTTELIKTNSYGTLNAVAEHLYNAGYRKQSEGEWIEQIKVARQSNKPPLIYYQCSLCDVYLAKRANFCPNCGAKMKGGAE